MLGNTLRLNENELKKFKVRDVIQAVGSKVRRSEFKPQYHQKQKESPKNLLPFIDLFVPFGTQHLKIIFYILF
jgi:hypothetical protein